MRKQIVLLISVLALVLSALFQPAAIAQVHQTSTAEASARAFYTWFIKRDSENRSYALMDKEVYRYVSKPTADFLRSEYRQNKFAEKSEYFTRVQDYDQQDWLAHMVMHPTVLVEDVAIVPITFGSAEKKTILAFLRNENGIWKIIKIDDIQADK